MDAKKLSINDDLSVSVIFKILNLYKYFIIITTVSITALSSIYYYQKPANNTINFELDIADEIVENYSQEVQKSKNFNKTGIILTLEDSIRKSLKNNSLLNEDNLTELLSTLVLNYRNPLDLKTIKVKMITGLTDITILDNILKDVIVNTEKRFKEKLLQNLAKILDKSNFYMDFYVKAENSRIDKTINEIENRFEKKRLDKRRDLLEILNKNLIIAKKLNINENTTNITLISITDLENYVNLFELGTEFLKKSVLFIANYEEEQIQAEISFSGELEKLIQQNNLTLYEITKTTDFIENSQVLNLESKIYYDVVEDFYKILKYVFFISFIGSIILILGYHEYK